MGRRYAKRRRGASGYRDAARSVGADYWKPILTGRNKWKSDARDAGHTRMGVVRTLMSTAAGGSAHDNTAFGGTPRLANTAQMKNRRMYNYWGPGRYFRGRGAYSESNAIVQGGVPAEVVPRHVSSDMDVQGGGGFSLSHTEFLGNVTVSASAAGTSVFSIQNYQLNPGIEQTFPFLSQIADNFSMYEWGGLIYKYKPTSGEFGAAGSNSLGKVMMVTQYDPDAPVFTSSVAINNYNGASSCKPSSGMVHGVECAGQMRATKQLYVRTGQSTKDKIFTDIGTFSIATEGIYSSAAGTQIIGELWVSYSIRLIQPNIQSIIGGAASGYDSAIANAVATSAGVLYPAGCFDTVRYNPLRTFQGNFTPLSISTVTPYDCSLSSQDATVAYQWPLQATGWYRVTFWSYYPALSGAPSMWDNVGGVNIVINRGTGSRPGALSGIPLTPTPGLWYAANTQNSLQSAGYGGITQYQTISFLVQLTSSNGSGARPAIQIKAYNGGAGKGTQAIAAGLGVVVEQTNEGLNFEIS